MRGSTQVTKCISRDTFLGGLQSDCAQHTMLECNTGFYGAKLLLLSLRFSVAAYILKSSSRSERGSHLPFTAPEYFAIAFFFSIEPPCIAT